jgi:hypothetical protein
VAQKSARKLSNCLLTVKGASGAICKEQGEIVSDTKEQRIGDGETYLEPTHVSGVAGVLQAVLIALQEEFEEKSADEREERERRVSWRCKLCSIACGPALRNQQEFIKLSKSKKAFQTREPRRVGCEHQGEQTARAFLSTCSSPLICFPAEGMSMYG